MKKFSLTLLLVVTFALIGCKGTLITSEEILIEKKPSFQEETLVITAVGDIMMHNTQIQAGYHENKYDYRSFFTYVKPLFDSSDFVIGNLETTLAGQKAGYSGYPRFNSPEVLAFNLKDAGFDFLSTANNHCLDKGSLGMVNTLDTLEQAGLYFAGTARSQTEAENICLVQVKNIKIALLAYTYGTNGLSISKNLGHVNYLYPEKICEDIEKAKNQGAQLIFVCLHFGQEYQPLPSKEQKEITQLFFAKGADVILGSHPHVLQPAQIISGQREHEKQFVIYSLGNFISDQAGLERKSGVILNLYFTLNPLESKPILKEVRYIPIWTHSYVNKGKRTFSVLPIEPALISVKRGGDSFASSINQAGLEKSWEHILHNFDSEPLIKPEQLPIPLEGLFLLRSFSSDPNI